MDLKILYEDNHLICVYKPENMLSQQDITDELDILRIVKNYLKEKYQKKGDAYLGLLHRLDRNTRGLMLFAKTSKAAARISSDIVNHNFEKWYRCWVFGEVLDDGVKTLSNYLKKNEKENKSYVSPDGKLSILSYEVLENKPKKTLLKVMLTTGRHHQIRVQLAHIGHPLIGDMKYGNKAGDYYLEAYHLGFNHPVTKEWIVIEI